MVSVMETSAVVPTTPAPCQCRRPSVGDVATEAAVQGGDAAGRVHGPGSASRQSRRAPAAGDAQGGGDFGFVIGAIAGVIA